MVESVTLAIGDVSVRQLDGLFSLNDLHAAAGGSSKDRPANFLRRQETQALIAELQHQFSNSSSALSVVNGGDAPGTYACRELVIAYAAWISAAFHLKVIRVFLAQQQPLAPVQHAIAMGSLIGSHVHQIVTQAVLDGGHDYKNQRWVLSFITDTKHAPVPMVDKVAANALFLSVDELAQAITEPGGMLLSNAELANLALACNKRLSMRIAQTKKIGAAA